MLQPHACGRRRTGRSAGHSTGACSNHTRAPTAPQQPVQRRSRFVCSAARPATAADSMVAQATTPPQPASSSSEPLPATYRKLVAKRTGSSFRDVAEVVEAPLPVPGPNEVLVRVTHAGINGGCETFRVRGEHAFAGNRAKHEYALGAEGAGVVVALGEQVRQQQQQQQQGQQQQQQQQGAGVAVGQRVAVNGGAAFAEFCVVPAASVTPVTCSAPEAVALTLSALTAAAALQETARVQPREVVLVTAAAGGTGHFGVQLAQLAGARVVAVAGGAAKKERLAALGLERVIDYKCEDVAAVLAAEYPQGVDVVYEGVGGALRAAIMRHLAPGARVLQVGYISEYPHTSQAVSPAVHGGLPMDQFFWGGKSAELPGGGKVFGQVWPKDPAAIRACRQRVFELHAAGQLHAWVDTSHGFAGVEQVPDAIEYMLRGGHIGKVVIPL